MGHVDRDVIWAILGGGGHSYIRVMPDGFLLRSTQIQKKSVGQNMNIWITPPPPPGLLIPLTGFSVNRF